MNDKIVREHKLKYLIHFSLVSNLASILKYGLLSREELEKKHLNYYYTDNNRYDKQFDKVSLSITIPNEKMFKAKQIQNKQFWIILMLDINLLKDSELEFYYCYKNASHNKMIEKWNFNVEKLKELSSFEEMFRNSRYINVPTDRQAEIMVKGAISPNYIKGIIVKDGVCEKIVEEVIKLLGREDIKIIVRKNYFI